MLAKCENKLGEYDLIEMGQPICGRDFCDTCGDCLVCYNCDCNNTWVLYIDNPLNPNYNGDINSLYDKDI